MTDSTTTRQHLHRDDYPQTLRLLEGLRNGRPAEEWATIGYEPTEYGAWVDWDQLAGSWLSSTEQAVVHIARGAATLERSGGPAPRMAGTVAAVIADVCSVHPMAHEVGAVFAATGGDEWLGAIDGGIDVRRLRDVDADLAQALLELDEATADVLLQIGARDVTNGDRAAHVKKMRRRLALLTADLTDRLIDLE